MRGGAHASARLGRRALLAAEPARLKEQVARLSAELEQYKAGHGAEQERLKRLALEAEEAKEKRVRHLQQVATRRIGQLGLARGWSAWVELCETKRYQKQLLRGASNRLRKPKLAAAFGAWSEDWEAAERSRLEAGRELLYSQEVAKRRALQEELAALRAEQHALLTQHAEHDGARLDDGPTDALPTDRRAAVCSSPAISPS